MISGIILAGGAGSRMQGKDKGLIVWEQRTLVDHVIETLAPQVENLVINANRHHRDYQQRGYPVFPDKNKQLLGPLAGIDIGLEWTKTPWLAVAPCDSPLFPSDYVQRLYTFAQQKQLPLVWVYQGGQDHPLFCLIHRQLHGALKDFLYRQGKRRVLDFFNAHGSALYFRDALPNFVNFNTEDSLLDPLPMQKGHP